LDGSAGVGLLRGLLLVEVGERIVNSEQLTGKGQSRFLSGMTERKAKARATAFDAKFAKGAKFRKVGSWLVDFLASDVGVG